MALVRSLWRHNFPILQSLMGGRLEASAPPFPCMALSGISSGPDSSNEASTSSGLGWLKGPVSKQKAALEDNEWIAESQSSASGSQTIWRSVITGEATAPGVPKPQTWHQVVDKKSGLIYYWCPEANETTELGEARPGAYGRKAIYKEKRQRSLESSEGKGNDKDLSFAALYNNPLGWLLLGMALWGIAAKALF